MNLHLKSAQRLLAVAAIVATLVPAGITAAAAQPTNTKANKRCTKENAERTIKGQTQRCTRNKRGALRWQAATAPESPGNAKVIQVLTDSSVGTTVGPIAYMQDGSLLAFGTFWNNATLGNFSVEREFLGPTSAWPWGSYDTGFIATISPNFEWTSARQFGGTSTQSAGFDFMVPLRDNSAFVAGRFRGRLNIDGTTYRAERNDAEDTMTTRRQWGYSQTAHFGRIRADGTWVWHRAWPTAGGSWIKSAHELADGSLLVSGGYSLVPNHAPKTGYASSDKHVVVLYSHDGQLLSSRQVAISPNIEGSWIDFKVSSLLQDGSVILTGFYCGSLSFGDKSLPVSGAPRVNSKGSITPFCDPQAYWMMRPSGFVAKVRSDLSVEWLVDLEPSGSKPLDSQIRVHGSAVSQTGEIVIIGELSRGEYRFGKTSLKARNSAATGSSSEKIGFVAGIDTNGKWRWAMPAGINLRTILSTPDNKFVVAGFYEQPGVTLGTYRLTTASDFDGFAAKLDGSGRWEWLNGISFPGPRNEELNSSILDMAVASDGSVAVAGFTYANVQFGSTPVTSEGDIATGFVARLSPSGVWK